MLNIKSEKNMEIHFIVHLPSIVRTTYVHMPPPFFTIVPFF